jgi:RHS repeat-associated protein
MQGAGGVGGLLKEGDRYPTYDANGNIMQKLDGAGAMVMNIDYDPFGNIINGSLVGEYGFSTKPLVKGLDWYYYGYRYYDPVAGRWPSRDPIGEAGWLVHQRWSGNFGVSLAELNPGSHNYAFIFNNPSLYYDYLGMAAPSGWGTVGPGVPTVGGSIFTFLFKVFNQVFSPCISAENKFEVETHSCLHVCSDPCMNGAFNNQSGQFTETVEYTCYGNRWNKVGSTIESACDAAACPSGYDDDGYNPSRSAP